MGRRRSSVSERILGVAMPILNIEFIGNVEKINLSRSLADAIGAVMGSSPGQTWVKVKFLPTEFYAENNCAKPAFEPVFVSVLMRALPEQEERTRLADGLSGVIASISERPKESVHVIFEPEGQGRVAFGGVLS